MSQTWEKLKQYKSVTDEEIEKSLKDSIGIIKQNLEQFTYQFPTSNSFDNFYEPSDNVEWTTGFWTGIIWLAYEYTNQECFKEVGEIQVESFLKRIEDKIDVNHHDMGFLYSLSCVAAYKLTGNEKGKDAAIKAADHLASRYREVGQFLQAWGSVGEPSEYRLIIDCLLNLPILYWATQVTGDFSYQEKAQNHIKTAMKCVMREDKSTYHTYYFDTKTGEPIKGVTAQGNRNGSAWARGQAWGIYGIALSYRYLKDESYKQLFFEVTDYFMEHLPDDLIAYWDFDFDTGSLEPRDSSSVAIAVCGIYEMIKYLDGEIKRKYEDLADKLLHALIKHCKNKDIKSSNGLLLHGTYARSSDENTCRNRGVDECNTWGDYFYMEALMRKHKDWNLYW